MGGVNVYIWAACVSPVLFHCPGLMASESLWCCTNITSHTTLKQKQTSSVVRHNVLQPQHNRNGDTVEHCTTFLELEIVETQCSTTTKLQKCRKCSNIMTNNIELNIKCKNTRFYNHCRNVKSVETGRHILLQPRRCRNVESVETGRQLPDLPHINE